MDIPYMLDCHLFHFIDYKEQARIHKQAARRISVKAKHKGQWFFMDFDFMPVSTAKYDRPDSKKDRVVHPYDGYSTYLMAVD